MANFSLFKLLLLFFFFLPPWPLFLLLTDARTHTDTNTLSLLLLLLPWANFTLAKGRTVKMANRNGKSGIFTRRQSAPSKFCECVCAEKRNFFPFFAGRAAHTRTRVGLFAGFASTSASSSSLSWPAHCHTLQSDRGLFLWSG